MSKLVTARAKAKRQIRISVLEALSSLATKPCNKLNCGTVCLCEYCHARRALNLLQTFPEGIKIFPIFQIDQQ